VFVPTHQHFLDASDEGLIGNTLLAEHVHPNIEGQFVLADAFYEAIVESALIQPVSDPYSVKTKEYYRNSWAYTRLDSLVGAYKIEQLKSHWPFTSLDVEYTFRDTFRTSGLIDSLAFIILKDPEASLTSLHDILGGYYEESHEFELACREYEALIAINPYRSTYYNKAARIYLKLNDLHAAELCFRKSVEFVESFYAWTMLAEIEKIKQNYAGAVEAFTSALEFLDEDMSSEEDGIRRELNNLKKQMNSRNRTTGFEYGKYIPQDIESLYSKALHYLESDADSSMYYLSRCLEINDCPLVNWQMGNVLMKQQDKRVLYYYTKAHDGFSNSPQFLVNLFVANLVNENKSGARLILNELIVLDPSNSRIPGLQAALK